MAVESSDLQRSGLSEGLILEKRKNIAIIRLAAGAEGGALSVQKLKELKELLQELGRDKELTGLVLAGSSLDLFSPGLQVEELEEIQSQAQAQAFAELGQEVFTSLRGLPLRKVAAISGACIGAALELALACDWRIGLSHAQTRFGFTELKLGLIPAMGGARRLVELAGLRAALEIVFSPRLLNSQDALALGLLDDVLKVEPAAGEEAVEKLIEAALTAAHASRRPERPASLGDKLLSGSKVRRWMLRRRFEKKLSHETRGRYTAPMRLLAIMTSGAQEGEARAKEKEEFAALVLSPEGKALRHLYFASEQSSRLTRALKAKVRSAKVGVLGAGTMGSGIAVACARGGHHVAVVDPYVQARDRVREAIAKALEGRAKENELAALQITEDLGAMRDRTFILEAVPEEEEMKKEVFRKLATIAPPAAVLATNTAALSISALAEAAGDASRVIGMRFVYPPDTGSLVEIIRHKNTADRTTMLASAFAATLNKYCVIVEDQPGFLVNRMLGALFSEAAHLLAEGFSVADIDQAAQSYGFIRGPLRTMDEIGFDLVAKLQESLERSYGERMKIFGFASTMVEKGRLGLKTHRGFYFYENGKATPDYGVRALLGLNSPSASLEPSQIQDRLVLALLNEAVRCWDEGVAGAPGRESGYQIDLASVMGLSFPAFRGGILYSAQLSGWKKALESLENFEKKLGARFKAAEGIRQRAGS